jgi:CHAT domain-containing protein/tetratricopeptide (TPR) repeat protein
MTARRQRWVPVWASALALGSGLSGPAGAIEPPAACREQPPWGEVAAPIADLRREVESLNESDPIAAFRLMCDVLPRVERERGPESLEYAWWVQSLATPLIAYLERYDEAVALLEYARPILMRELGPNAPEIAELHVAYAWMRYRQGLNEQAAEEWGAALRIREIVPGPKQIELQKVLVGLAQVRAVQRDFATARRLLERAQAILAENQESVSEAAAAIENSLTSIAMREENFADARRHAEAQLAIELELRKTRGPAQLGAVYVTLGQVLERLDEFDAAEAALREAVRLSDAPDSPPQRHTLKAVTQLAILLNARGRPHEAQPLATRAVALGEKELGAGAPMLVRILVAAAEIERNLGDLPRALRYYERAAAIVARHRADIEQQVLAGFYRGYGSLECTLGDPARCAALLDQALGVTGADPKLSTERAAALRLLAVTSEPVAGSVPQAQLEESLELYRARLPESHPVLLQVVNDLCGLEIEARATQATSCANADARLAMAREVEPSLRYAVHANASRLAASRGNPPAAYARALQALAAAEVLGTPDPAWRARFGLAALLEAREDPSLAIYFGKEAIVAIEALRATMRSEAADLQRGFLHDKVAVYRTVADWLMESGRIDEALNVLDLLKEEELTDFVRRAGLRDAGGVAEGVPLTAEEESLRARYRSLLRTDAATGAEIDRLSRLAATGRITAIERERLATLLNGQRDAEAARAARIAGFVGESVAPPASGRVARRVQAARLERDVTRFGPNAALGVYLLTDTHLRLLVATRAGQSEHVVPIDAARLRRDIGRFLEAIEQRADVTQAAQSLYGLIVKPLDDAARAAGATHLVIWPDGALRYVPYAALHDGDRFLIDRYALQMYADDRVVQPVSVARPLTVRGLGVTRAVGGYSALPAVAEELCAIVRGPISGLATTSGECDARGGTRGALPGEGFADEAFTESRLASLLQANREFSVLHVGTHFSLRPGNAVRSFLLLGDGQRLTLDRLGDYDFSGLELATLSGCQTGLAGATGDDGREVEGLATLVQRRGARRVIASLWRVEDVSTARLMRDLYVELATGAGDSAAGLRASQLALRAAAGSDSRLAHPYYWAGFTLSGAEP